MATPSSSEESIHASATSGENKTMQVAEVFRRHRHTLSDGMKNQPVCLANMLYAKFLISEQANNWVETVRGVSALEMASYVLSAVEAKLHADDLEALEVLRLFSEVIWWAVPKLRDTLKKLERELQQEGLHVNLDPLAHRKAHPEPQPRPRAVVKVEENTTHKETTLPHSDTDKVTADTPSMREATSHAQSPSLSEQSSSLSTEVFQPSESLVLKPLMQKWVAKRDETIETLEKLAKEKEKRFENKRTAESEFREGFGQLMAAFSRGILSRGDSSAAGADFVQGYVRAVQALPPIANPGMDTDAAQRVIDEDVRAGKELNEKFMHFGREKVVDESELTLNLRQRDPSEDELQTLVTFLRYGTSKEVVEQLLKKM